MRYLLDTNVISAILKGNKTITKKIENVLESGDDIFMSGISYYEIKRGLMAAKAENQLKRFDYFCEEIGLILLDTKNVFDEASKIYANLKQKGHPVGDADILIASSAKLKDMIIVTNDDDFNYIEGLRKENWSTDIETT